MDYTALAEQLNRLHSDYMRELCMVSSALSSRGESAVLICLYLNPQPTLPGEISAKIGLTSGRVANILKVLERKGLILRMQESSDRRQIHVSLTEDGLRAAQELWQNTIDDHRSILAYLGEADAPEFVRLFEKCLQYYRQNTDHTVPTE